MAAHQRAEGGSDEWRPAGAEVWFRSPVECAPAVLYVNAPDETSSVLYLNPQSESLLGYSREEWLEDPGLWATTLHPEDRGRVLAEHSRARKSADAFETEYRLVARGGSVVWVRDQAVSIDNDGGESVGRAGVLLDITERRRHEEALRESEERFRLVASVTGEAIWDSDLLTGTQEWAGATEVLFGYPPHEGRTEAWWEERVHPDDKERVLSGLAAVLGEDRGLWEEEYRFRRADGSHAHVLDRGRVVRDGDGRPVRIVGAMTDVTRYRLHEEELRRSEELFRTTFELAAVGIAHVTLDGRWLRVNDKLCEILGYRREELLNLHHLDLVLPEDVAAGEDRAHRLLSGETGPYTVERRYVGEDGRRVWVKLDVSLARPPSGGPDFLVCVAEDITARKVRELVPEPLTDLEAEVLARIVDDGSSNRDMARDLRYSMGSIKRCVRGVIAKLGVRDRRGAAVRAIEIGLVPPPY